MELLVGGDFAGLAGRFRHEGEVGCQARDGVCAGACEGPAVVELDGADEVAEDAAEGDDAVAAVDAGGGEDGQHCFGPAQDVAGAVSVGDGERDDGWVGAYCVAEAVGHGVDLSAPRPGRGFGVDGVEYACDDEVLEFVAVVHVAVEGHGAHAEFFGDGSHGECGEAVAVDDGEGGGGEVGVGQRAWSWHGA